MILHDHVTLVRLVRREHGCHEHMCGAPQHPCCDYGCVAVYGRASGVLLGHVRRATGYRRRWVYVPVGGMPHGMFGTRREAVDWLCDYSWPSASWLVPVGER